MKSLILATLVLVSSLFTQAAEANPRALEHIDRALQITNVEMQAIYSGRYRFYRPETIRNVLGQLQQEASAALYNAESVEARTALDSLLRSAQEEVGYSYRFQYYRLESTRLLMVNYQRFLNQARQSETMHSGTGSLGGHRACQPPSRVACLN